VTTFEEFRQAWLRERDEELAKIYREAGLPAEALLVTLYGVRPSDDVQERKETRYGPAYRW
jgi:hypothetical protein